MKSNNIIGFMSCGKDILNLLLIKNKFLSKKKKIKLLSKGLSSNQMPSSEKLIIVTRTDKIDTELFSTIDIASASLDSLFGDNILLISLVSKSSKKSLSKLYNELIAQKDINLNECHFILDFKVDELNSDFIDFKNNLPVSSTLLHTNRAIEKYIKTKKEKILNSSDLFFSDKSKILGFTFTCIQKELKSEIKNIPNMEKYLKFLRITKNSIHEMSKLVVKKSKPFSFVEERLLPLIDSSIQKLNLAISEASKQKIEFNNEEINKINDKFEFAQKLSRGELKQLVVLSSKLEENEALEDYLKSA